MLKIIQIICLLSINIVLATVCFSADFRSFNWGDSRDKVQKSHKKKPEYNTSTSLGYPDSIAGMKCKVSYSFENNKLTSASYIINEEHTNAELYIEDYNTLKNQLTTKYGEPVSDEIEWTNGTYKDFMPHGTAIAVGYLRYETRWDTDRTHLVTTLSGDNFDTKHFIHYYSKEHLKNDSSGSKKQYDNNL